MTSRRPGSILVRLTARPLAASPLAARPLAARPLAAGLVVALALAALIPTAAVAADPAAAGAPSSPPPAGRSPPAAAASRLPPPQSPASSIPSSPPHAAPAAGTAPPPAPAPPVAPAPAAPASGAPPAFNPASAATELGQLADQMASASTDQELAKIGSAAADIEQRADAALSAQSLAYAGVAERLRRFSEWRYRRLSAAERRDEAALLAKRQALDAAIAPTRAAAAKAGRLYSLVAQRRRESFSARVLERSPSPLTPAFWTSLAAAAGDDLARTLALVSRSLGVAVRAPFPRAPLGLGASLLLAVVIAGPVRVWLESFARRAGSRKTPPGPARRTLRAIFIALVDVGAPTLAAALVRVGAEWGDLLSASADALAASLVAAVAWGSAIVALGRVLATDKDPELRLIALTDPEAARIRRALWAVAFVTASGFVVHQISFTVGASLPASIAATSALALAYAAAAGFTLMSAGPRGAGEAGSRDALKASTAWTLISVPVALSIVATVASVLLGFVTLASLISGQMFWLSLIAAVTYLLVTLIDDLFTALLDPSGSSVRALTVHLGLRSSTVAQAGLLVSAALQITVLLAAIALALTPYGQSGELLLAHARELGGPIHLGKATISPSAVIAGLATFAIGMALAHGARGWVTRRYLPITPWDAGLKNSVSTGIGYVGAGIALLCAFAVMGLSFQQIALIASALSVGIGFGLQQIVQNFVAGVILLIERPVKIGDWVNVGGVEGDVRRIRVRATEIQSFDRSTIIVPNSNLITMNVQNKTLGDERGRIQLQFTIAKPADARKTADLVRDAARAREEILRDPEPSVFADSFATGGGVTFNCYFYIDSPRHAARVRSALLFQIIEDLQSAEVALL